MKPISGWRSARPAKCSPAPKPISIQSRDFGSSNRVVGSATAASRGSIRSRGSKLSTNSRRWSPSLLPTRRPWNWGRRRAVRWSLRMSASSSDTWPRPRISPLADRPNRSFPKKNPRRLPVRVRSGRKPPSERRSDGSIPDVRECRADSYPPIPTAPRQYGPRRLGRFHGY